MAASITALIMIVNVITEAASYFGTDATSIHTDHFDIELNHRSGTSPNLILKKSKKKTGMERRLMDYTGGESICLVWSAFVSRLQ
jgi:hypothetical protein